MTELHSTGKLPFTLDDLFQLSGLSAPQLSLNGSQIVCVITKTNESQNCTEDHIALISVADKQQKTIARGASPCWSPDGSEIAYETDAGELWIYNLAENEKRYLAKIYHSDYFMGHLTNKNFAWSPDGKYIAYVSASPFSSSDATEKDVRVIDRLLYKTKGGRNRSVFTDDYLTHIYVVPASGGEPELITPGNYNEHSISWSPNSFQIAFISNRSFDPDNNQYDDLWKVNIQTKAMVRLTDDLGTAFQPAWSPDGKSIAYLATTSIISTNDSPADDTHLYLIPTDGGPSHCLTKLLDRRIENICWHPKGGHIYFTAGNEGRTPIYWVSIASNKIEPLVNGEFHILEYSVGNSGKDIAYVRTDTKHPAEIFLTMKDQTNPIQMTYQNDALVNSCTLQDVESFWFESFDKTPVQGWIMKPAYFTTTKLYPLILVIHGGPHNMFGYEFEERMQLLSAHGFGVLFINPRGSSGYGQSFSNGCVLNWGGGDYKDLMAGVDYCLDHYTWIDKEKLGVTGQSYGGYMTNWIITQTQRFKAAVVDGGISNLISFSGTSLYHSLMESEFNGNAHDNFPLLWQWSPLRNVKNVTTPTLFVHGDTDNEVPVSQAEEMYVALKKCGVKTSFVQYVGEGHGWRPDLKPENKYDLYQRMMNWFKQNLDII